MKINWQEASTYRAVVWTIAFVIGLGMIATGHGDVEKLLLLTGGVVGGMGFLPDKLPK